MPIPTGVLIPSYTSANYNITLANAFANVLQDSSATFQITLGPSTTANSNTCYSLSGTYGIWGSESASNTGYANVDYGSIAPIDVLKTDYSNILMDFLSLVATSNAGTIVYS